MRRRLAFLVSLALSAGLGALALGRARGGAASAREAPPPQALASATVEGPRDIEREALERRRRAHALDAVPRGPRRTADVALDEAIAGVPWDGAAEASAVLAVDGDESTAWRGDPAASVWVWTLPLLRPVHASLLRMSFGDASDRGVPVVYRWEYRRAAEASCDGQGDWEPVPGAAVDDREPDQFVYGPHDVHVRHQAVFVNVDACALRLVVAQSSGGAPVVREVHLLEGAASLGRAPGVVATAEGGDASAGDARAVLDGDSATAWRGAAARDRWSLTLRLPAPRTVDRLALVLGDGARLVRPGRGPGRRYAIAWMPTRYEIAASPDADDAHLERVAEADAPTHDGVSVSVGRRLVRFDRPRVVQVVRLTLAAATGASGKAGRDAAPVVRDLGLYEAADARPVVLDPLFLSVNANPSALTHRMRRGEATTDDGFAEDAYVRLRRTIVGFDTATGNLADYRKRYAVSAGRYLEAVEGDDPTLDAPWLEALSPPPALLLSGSLDWDVADHTLIGPAEPDTGAPTEHLHGWNVLAPAASADRGMGQLAALVRRRALPIVGFCGGAHILALLEARGEGAEVDASEVADRVLARNVNISIRPLRLNRRLYERAWWTDAERVQARRPVVRFDPVDPLFAGLAAEGSARDTTRELPLSHVDMVRPSAFSDVLSGLRPVAFSEFCAPWVHADGVEPTRGAEGEGPCVRVPQAFRSTDERGYPIVGFQFHPEQRDFQHPASDSPHDAKADAMNVFGNAVQLVLDAYVRLYWPHA